MNITTETATVYRAPTAGRRYFTKSAAIHAEACAIIKRKHETVNDPGDHITPGEFWFWRTDLPRAEVLLRRMKRLVKRAIDQAPGGQGGGR